MQTYRRLSTRALMMVGMSLSAIMTVGAATALSVYHDDDVKAEKAQKKHKTVKVIRTGKEPVIIDHSGSHVIVERKGSHRDHGSKTFSYVLSSGGNRHSEALEKINKSLSEIEEHLEKVKKKSERKALEAARDGLVIARDALAMGGAHRAEMRRGHRMALAQALNDVELYEGDMDVDIEVDTDMEDVRRAVSDALGDFDVEIDLDGNVRRLHIDDLHRKQLRLEGLEAEDLEALRQAEEHLRATRERLEKKLAEKNHKKDN